MGSCTNRYRIMNEPTIPTIPKIKKAIAEGFEVSIQEIDSRTKRHPIALARQCVYYYTRKLLGMKYDDMEEIFDRDHSNFIYACHQIRDRRIYDWETKAMLEGIEDEFPWLKGKEVEA